MPQRLIEAIEYECERCGYKWINRREKPKPRYCAKCKHPKWDSTRMSRYEKALRYRVRRLDGMIKIGEMFGNRYLVNTDICTRFLYTEPRPTIEELTHVIHQFEHDTVRFMDIVNMTSDETEEYYKSKKERGRQAMLDIVNEREKHNNTPAEPSQ